MDLGRYWYEPKGVLLHLIHRKPFFRQDRFPIQANIVIGPENRPPSWHKTSAFAARYMESRGYEILEEHHITVLGIDHYAVSYMLGRQIPTRKYSVVLEHQKLKQYVEFAFTISVYGSIEDFYQNIGEGDMLVRSFTWI
ncbi:MAG: hypothetical protein SVO01_02635 [Thermotogota bacterium]|nr:hypothetical protein [Thermotogota bacterium]